jgi:dTDP-4-dehydrorhamnose reductase
VLLVGLSSKLSKALREVLWDKGQSDVFTVSLRDIRDPVQHLVGLIELNGITSVVYFSVVSNEQPLGSSAETIEDINVRIPTALAKFCCKAGVAFVAFSSTRVFNEKESFYKSNSPYSPTTNYGRSKVRLEDGVLSSGGTVIRLSKVLAPTDELFAEWNMFARNPDEYKVEIFRNVYIAPIFPVEVARAVEFVLNESSEEQIFQFSRQSEFSYEELFGMFLELGDQNHDGNKSLIGATIKESPKAHASLECDRKLEYFLGNFSEQFSDLIEESANYLPRK